MASEKAKIITHNRLGNTHTCVYVCVGGWVGVKLVEHDDERRMRDEEISSEGTKNT